MAQDTTPSMIIYQGDGSNNVFSIPFDKGYYGAISVAFVRRGLTEYEYNPTTYSVSGFYYAWSSNGNTVYTNTTIPSIGSVIYNARGEDTGNTVSFVGGSVITVNGVNYARTKPSDINHNALLTWTGDVLNVGDFICIVRNTELGQPFVYPNNQKHIEDALDNLERQIQEVKSADGFALHVDPSYETDPNKMNPIDWLQTIIRSKDLSVRAFRFLNGWVDYSFDDPEKADADKEWFHLLNTDNIVSVREMHDIDEEGKDIYWTEYQDQYGEWKTLSNAPLWEKQLDEIQETADNALAVAEEAKTIAGNAEAKSDLAIIKSESAFSMATESLAKSDTALANSEYAVETSDTANAKSDVAVATSARAEDKSDTAVATSVRAEAKADQAVTTSQEALAGVQSAIEAAEQAVEAAERATEAAEAAEEAVREYDGRIQEAQDNAAEALSKVGAKQDQLTSANAGVGIAITEEDGKTIISNTQTSAEWGNITGDITAQADLQDELDNKTTVIIRSW